MKCEADYIRKYGTEEGKKKYHIYKLWKIAEAKRREDPEYWKNRCKKSAELHKNRIHKQQEIDKLKIPHKERWTAYSYEYEKIENYDLAKADNFKGWNCHHRLELHPDGSTRFTRNSLIRLDLYVNRPASELIFLRTSEHKKLHGVNRWE